MVRLRKDRHAGVYRGKTLVTQFLHISDRGNERAAPSRQPSPGLTNNRDCLAEFLAEPVPTCSNSLSECLEVELAPRMLVVDSDPAANECPALRAWIRRYVALAAEADVEARGNSEQEPEGP
jgi:hypothetical protein